MRPRCAALVLWIAIVGAAPTAEASPDTPLGVGIVGAYDDAVARLEQLCADYRRIRAIQLATRRNIAFGEAHDLISSVMPELVPIERDLLQRAIVDPADIVPHKQAVILVEAQVQMMVDLAARLLVEIEQVHAELQAQEEHGPEQDLDLAEIVSRETFDPDQAVVTGEVRPEATAQLEALTEAARETKNEPARDLTALMRPLVPDIKDLTTTDDADPAQPTDLFVSASGPDSLTGRVDLNTLNWQPGRRIAHEGNAVEWQFIDTWYTIGPFPNPHRMNIHRQFPPETVIDLSASYIGKGDRAVRWQFVQSNEARVIPADPEEYAIYYAYTELWFDRPMDLWVAIGSDDRGEIWLNDLPIWISSDQLKGWRINEGFRKVSFQAGRNRILYRVENGWRGVEFSLGLRIAE